MTNQQLKKYLLKKQYKKTRVMGDFYSIIVPTKFIRSEVNYLICDYDARRDEIYALRVSHRGSEFVIRKVDSIQEPIENKAKSTLLGKDLDILTKDMFWLFS